MRLFVAVEISNENILKSIKMFQTELNIDAKAVELQNIHFTLLFLGEVSDTVLIEIQKALNSIEFTTFTIRLVGTGVFPKFSNPRVVWVGTDPDGAENLKNLSGDVEKVLLPLGFKSDKPFKPHLTVFRIKNRIGDISKDLIKYQGFEFGSQLVSEIKLKKSILTNTGPVYSDLRVVKAKL
jgi:2'-5' RNA ligase